MPEAREDIVTSQHFIIIISSKVTDVDCSNCTQLRCYPELLVSQIIMFIANCAAKKISL